MIPSLKSTSKVSFSNISSFVVSKFFIITLTERKADRAAMREKEESAKRRREREAEKALGY